MVQIMKYLFVEPSPLTILIPLEPKYSPQDPDLLPAQLLMRNGLIVLNVRKTFAI